MSVLIRCVQSEELAPCMSHASDFSYAELKAGLVAVKIVADQLAGVCEHAQRRGWALTP